MQNNSTQVDIKLWNRHPAEIQGLPILEVEARMINIIFKYYGTHNIIKLLKENRRLKIKVRVLSGAVEWALGERGVTARTLKVRRPRWWIKELKNRAALWESEEAKFKEAP